MIKFFAGKNTKVRQIRRGLEIAMVLVLALYPLRHIHRGLDLWDVGYNYANFQFMGMESMDPMWLFSTYLATALGHVFTWLPFGKTVLGLNFYTGLIVSVLAVMSYVFMTRHLKVSAYAVFFGEFIAISLCWCPTALLYNYLTYVLMLIAVINIYLGLVKENRWSLFIAGICLGLNVFVRFSNLPQAVFIFGVWAYCILEFIERIKDKNPALKRRERRDLFKRIGLRTLWCVMGYAAAAAGMLIYFGIRYGITEYFDAIKRLFSMTEDASGYSAFSMIYSIYSGYKSNLVWTGLILAFIVLGAVLVGIGKMLDAQLEMERYPRGIFGKKFTFTGVAYFITVLLAGVMVYLLCVLEIGNGQYRAFGYGDFDEYPAIIVPGIVLTFIMILWAFAVIVFTKEDIKEKLIAGLVLIMLLITPIGSNNGLLTTINNLFLPLPWFVCRIAKLLIREDPYAVRASEFMRKAENKDKKPVLKILLIIKSYLSFFSVKAVLFAVIVLCCVKFIGFGYGFSFAEAKNARDAKYTIESQTVFRGIRMSYEKALAMYTLMEFLDANDLSDGRELITYGYIPALSFYLQMPSAFNPWMDLASYKYDVMKENMYNLCETAERIRQEEIEEIKLPLIIVSKALAKYADGINDGEDLKEVTDRKFMLILDLIKAGQYEPVYENDMFAVFTDGR